MEKGVAVNGTRTVGTVEPVVIDCHLPAGMAGPSALSFDVRCFVCPHDTGVVLVDTGTPGSAATISIALNAIGASWDDVSDIVLTHAHFDHTGGLLEVARLTPGATIWVGASDLPEISVPAGHRLLPLVDEDRVRQFRVLHTPGHTPGHLSLLQEESSVLLLGDLAGTMDGQLVRPPEVFTADPALCDLSLRRAAELDARRVLPSHGIELSTRSPAGELIDLLDRVRGTGRD